MIVDTSALIAIVFKEPGHVELIHKMTEAEYLGIGTPTLAETGIVLSARLRRAEEGQFLPGCARNSDWCKYPSAMPIGEKRSKPMNDLVEVATRRG